MLLLPVIIVVIVLIVWYKQYENSFFNKPKNYPFPENIDKPIFVAFGDSLTQANMSASWFDIVENINPNYKFYNAGMNADLSYTLLTRINDVIDCNPQVISILVGSNDVMATMSADRMKRYYDLKKISQEANFEGFVENYKSIIQILLSHTKAKILVVSLPPITEDWTHEGNLKGDEYSEVIKNIAIENNLIYIPFREELRKKMPEKSAQLDDFNDSVQLLRKSVLKKNFLGQSWNQISASRHAMFLTDNIHLNDTAAAILAELINKEIPKNGNERNE